MKVAIVAGAIPALVVVALVVLGIAMLYVLLETFVVGEILFYYYRYRYY